MTGPGPTSEELRDALAEAASWVSGYLETVSERPVLAQVEPGEIAARLPRIAPEEGEPLESIMADVDALILPGITHWNHPAFFAYFGITGSGPGIVGELIASALNVNAMLWRTSPAATELEQRTLAWVLDLRHDRALGDGLKVPRHPGCGLGQGVSQLLAGGPGAGHRRAHGRSMAALSRGESTRWSSCRP